MAADENTIIWPISRASGEVLGISTQDSGDCGYETITATKEIYFANNTYITLNLDTFDGVCNENLSGTASLSVVEINGDGLCRDYYFEDDEGVRRNTLKVPKEGGSATVDGESYNISDRVKIISESGDNCNFKIKIEFSGTVETLNSGYDQYSIGLCCECSNIPSTLEDGTEDYCSCEDFVPDCLDDLDCPDGQECVDGECKKKGCTSDTDCPEGQVCKGGKCEDPDDPDPDCKCSESDCPCPDGKTCVNDKCVSDDDFIPIIGKPYYGAAMKKVELDKCGFDDSRYGRAKIDKHLTLDESIIYRRGRAIDVDEGCATFSGGTQTYDETTCSTSGGRVCNYDNSDGIVSASQTYNKIEGTLKGTNATSPNEYALDRFIFDYPYRSSELKTQLTSRFQGMTYPNDLKTAKILNRSGFSSTQSLSSQPKEAVLKTANEGIIAAFQFRFYKIIIEDNNADTFEGQNDSFAGVSVSFSTQYDSVSISEKDSLVPGRTSNELFKFLPSSSFNRSYPFTTILKKKFIKRWERSDSGTYYCKTRVQKLVATDNWEISPLNWDVDSGLIVVLNTDASDAPASIDSLLLADECSSSLGSSSRIKGSGGIRKSGGI